MPENTSTELRLATLNLDIEQLQKEAAQTKRERSRVRVTVAWRTCHLWYLQLATLIRSPAKRYELWYLAVLLVGPFASGSIAFILVDGATSSFSMALRGSAICIICVFTTLATLLYHPRMSQLPSRVIQAESGVRSANDHLIQLNGIGGLAGIQGRLRELIRERREVEKTLREELAGPMGRRAALLQQDWLGMRGIAWEEFLVKVFQELGARAFRIGGAGDQGVDLIAEIGTARIAVQAKGYEGAVNNKAIQEAFTGMVHYQCNACVVVTNSRFTPGAIEIAHSTNCILIGRDEFPEFVMGTLDLERRVNAILTRVEQKRTRAILFERIHQLNALEDRCDTLPHADAHGGEA